MTCEFCGCELLPLFASNDRDALFDNVEKLEIEPGSHICIDLNDYCIYEFWRTESVQPIDRYKHLCKKCAAGLDAFGLALLKRDNDRRILNYRNVAANVLNAIRGKEMHPYMVAVDVGVKDHPVAQVCRKDGERWVVTNMVMDDDVGHFMTYLEGSANA